MDPSIVSSSQGEKQKEGEEGEENSDVEDEGNKTPEEILNLSDDDEDSEEVWEFI